MAHNLEHANGNGHSNGSTQESLESAGSRLGMKRMAPAGGTATLAHPPHARATSSESIDAGQSKLLAKRMTEEKARARTLARGQAVAEKLSAATEQVSSAITEASSAVEEL